MKPLKALVLLAFATALSACVTPEPPSRTSTELLGAYAPQATPSETAAAEIAGPFNITQIRVVVPQNLSVSEANVFYPLSDIVWHGEPRGDRHAQVAAIFKEAMAQGTAGMTEGQAVIMDVVVTKFHAITPKARYTIGGMHTMHFDLTLRDAATGTILDGPRPVVADVEAAGGDDAIAEDEAGITQRSVIIDRLAEVIAAELGGALALAAL